MSGDIAQWTKVALIAVSFGFGVVTPLFLGWLAFFISKHAYTRREGERLEGRVGNLETRLSDDVRRIYQVLDTIKEKVFVLVGAHDSGSKERDS